MRTWYDVCQISKDLRIYNLIHKDLRNSVLYFILNLILGDKVILVFSYCFPLYPGWCVFERECVVFYIVSFLLLKRIERERAYYVVWGTAIAALLSCGKGEGPHRSWEGARMRLWVAAWNSIAATEQGNKVAGGCRVWHESFAAGPWLHCFVARREVQARKEESLVWSSDATAASSSMVTVDRYSSVCGCATMCVCVEWCKWRRKHEAFFPWLPPLCYGNRSAIERELVGEKEARLCTCRDGRGDASCVHPYMWGSGWYAVNPQSTQSHIYLKKKKKGNLEKQT